MNGGGRCQIWDRSRASHSKRAMNSKLVILKKFCSRCHHHKAKQNSLGVFCTKCGFEL